MEGIREEQSSSQLAMVALPVNSLSPVLEISIADPIVYDLLLASVDQTEGAVPKPKKMSEADPTAAGESAVVLSGRVVA